MPRAAFRQLTVQLFLIGTCWTLVGQEPDPLSVANELSSLHVLPGFEVHLFASENEGVIKPIQIRFDGNGRLWVAGSVTYPQIIPGQKANDKILVLEDTDHDGRVDRTTVFADGLMIPTGLELGDGGVYVGTGTELWHLRDTDGDGRADERRLIFSGFGTGDTHQTINSFTWGPSGELLMSQGLHAISRIETPWGTEQLRQSGVWRFWPRQLRLDAFWDGAMGAHNPFGTAFDRYGQPFVFAGNGHGVFHLTPAMIRTEHFQPQSAIWSQGRKFGGADFVENSHWPAANQGEVISGGYLQNTVERFRFTDSGAGFKAERLPPLIESTNTAFRIVDARFGPDGALYLCDWCNPVIGHYQASFRHPDRDKTHGRIWRVTATGRPLVHWQPLEQASVPTLLAQLRSSERWNRQLAQRILRDRPTATVTNELARWTATLNPNSATEETALFAALGAYAAQEMIEPVLLEKVAHAITPEIRAYAAHVAGHWADRLPDSLNLLSRLAVDPHPRVRLEAIVACAYVPDARAIEVAALALDQTTDGSIDYAFIQTVHALKPRWQEPFARGELKFGGRANRLEAFTRADRSADTVAVAISRLRRVGEVALESDTQSALLQLVADAGGPTDLAVLLPLSSHMIGTHYHAAQHAHFLDALGEAHRRRGMKPDGDLNAILKPLIENGATPVPASALRLAGVLGVESLHATASKIAQNTLAPDDFRAAAVESIAAYASPADRQWVAALAENEATPPPIRSRALAELARLDPARVGPAAAAFLAQPQASVGTTEIVLALLLRSDALTSFRTAITARPPAADNAKIALRLMAAAGRRDEILAAKLESAVGLSREPRKWSAAELLAFLGEVRTVGDAIQGAAIFHRPELNCAACHGINASTIGLGPDLGALGTAQAPEFIVGAILEPQREVKEGFNSIALTLRGGEELQGRVLSEDAEVVVLHDTLSRTDLRLRRDQITERHPVGSVMPAGLVDTLTRSEFRDLIKFLSGLGRSSP